MHEPVGVIGVGNMGGAMAARLLERGFPVTVRDVRARAEEPLVALGARRAPSPHAIAQACASILVVVVDAKQIDDVLSGDRGLLSALRPEHLVLIQSTIAPADAARVAAAIRARGALALDAPISGGPARARAGQISIMAAGADAAFERARPLFDALATRVFRVGAAPGLGSTMKLVNNLLAGVYLAAGAEACAIGHAAGLDTRAMAEAFAASSGQSWILADRLARVVADDRLPRAQMHILAKDLQLAEDLARSLGRTTTLGAATSALFSAAMASGLSDADDSALIFWAMR
ncbi:MAG TPA: NAD(P)-dependent oxidoreductase [Burkholderiaceae bacterium]|nr:NAD(P)-dependent oxidoreductase [Burkholderiaceae bacterium]